MSRESPTRGDGRVEPQRVTGLLRLLEHLRNEAVSANEELARASDEEQAAMYDERASWLRMLTPADLCPGMEATATAEWLLAGAHDEDQAQPGTPDGPTVAGLQTEMSVGTAHTGWSLERSVLWLAEHRALMRVLTAQRGTAEVLVTVRPPRHPEDVLEVRRPCPADAPLAAVSAALEEAACLLNADENRRQLRLVGGTARVRYR